MIRDIPKSDPFWKEFYKYLEETWWPAVKADPTEYDYWCSTAQERMGKFRVIASEEQEVLPE